MKARPAPLLNLHEPLGLDGTDSLERNDQLMTDLANHAAATGAGYTRVQYDRGAGKSPRYVSRYEKPMIGVSGAAGGLTTAEGHSDASQAAADTAALASLNGQRGHRYGTGATANQDGKGHTLTADVN